MKRLLFFVAAASLLLALPAAAKLKPGKKAAAHRVCAKTHFVPGNFGYCIRSLQWMLGSNEPAIRHGLYWRVRKVKPNGKFDARTAKSVRIIKYRLGFPSAYARDSSAGPRLWTYLRGPKQLPLKWRIRVGERRNRWEFARRHPPKPKIGAKVERWVALSRQVIAYNYANGNRYYYTQGSHRSDFVSGITNWPEGGDCSASTLGLAHLSGLDTSRMGGLYGWTGSMQTTTGKVVWYQGQSLAKLRPGDQIFYGHGRPYTHVTTYLGAGRVYSFGSTTCPCNLPVLYRFDARLARRYFGP